MVAQIQPKTFIRSGEGSISSYNFTDISSGTGMINFYLGTTTNTSAVYRLSNFTYYSDAIYTYESIATPGANFTLIGDIDFDVLINKPTTIKGLSIINIPIQYYRGSSGGAVALSLYLVAKIRKWNGSTETEIANGTSRTIGPETGTTVRYDMLGIDVSIPITVFKSGEYLRLTIELWAKNDDGAAYARIGHDPLSRTDATWTSTTVPTQSRLILPTRIDI